MLRELAELREDAAAACAKLAQRRLRRAQGLPFEPLREVLRAHPLAVSADGLQQASEALGEALQDDPPRPGRVARLASLRDFLLRLRALELEPGAAEELFTLPHRPLVRPPGDAGLHGALPPVMAERELPLLRQRQRRAELEEALNDALGPLDGLRGAIWEAAQAALSEAKCTPEDLHARGWSSENPRAVAEQVLAGTDAIVKDLGAWLLERNCGGADRHDVLHLIHAPPCAPAFPAGELQRTVRRWADLLRFDPSADRSIKLDEDDRPLKAALAHTEPVDPPHEIMLSVLPQEGPRTLSAMLGALSVAQLRAGPPADAPPEDLWLGDPAVAWACHALLEGLLLDSQFLKRCAKADLKPDDERALAMAAVYDARLSAARTLSSLLAHELGPSARATQAHRDAFQRATGANLPPGLALRELDPWLDSYAEVRGRALAARMREHLRDRFDEDWYRNPRALQALNGLWSRGGRSTIPELWTEVGGAPSTAPLTAWLTAACR